MNLAARNFLLLAVLSIFILSVPAFAGWSDWLKKAEDSYKKQSSSSSLTDEEVVKGLKEALSKGVKNAIASLGKEGGYLKNQEVKIPMPKKLAMLERGLRKIGQGKQVDDFIESMNHAAEKAVPELKSIFFKAIKKMTLKDAKNILTGSDDAATKYFERTSRPELKNKVLPIVGDATDKTKVTRYYKKVTDKSKKYLSYVPFVKMKPTDLDDYVSEKALDGLFIMMAKEEKNIRENPVARTTELLKKVFGSKN